jgi:tetratricopeptide (TPR) repeat protein
MNISRHQTPLLPSAKHANIKIPPENNGIISHLSPPDNPSVLSTNSSGSTEKIKKPSDDISVKAEKKLLTSKNSLLKISSSSYLSVDSMNSAGLLYLEKGDYRQARLFFEEALTYDPDNSMFLNNMGLSFYLDGNNNKAGLFFEKALKRNPGNMNTLVNLGIVYQKIKQYGKSANIFKKAFSINPDSPELLYNYAILLEETNQKKKAVFYFHKFLETAPEHLKAYTINVKKHLAKTSLNLKRTGSTE